jgi:hypothetical protein
VAVSVISDQGCNVAAIPADIEEKSSQVCRLTQEHEQERIVSERRHDCVSLLVLEDRCIHRSLYRRKTEALGFSDESGNASGEIFIVQSRGGKSFYQQAVLSQYENGVNSGALA